MDDARLLALDVKHLLFAGIEGAWPFSAGVRRSISPINKSLKNFNFIERQNKKARSPLRISCMDSFP